VNHKSSALREFRAVNKPPSRRKKTLDYSDYSDKDLLKAAGDEEIGAFKVIVQRHTKRAYWTAFNIVHNHEDAEDIAQEAFIRIHRFIDRYNPKQKFTTWFYQIVVNLSIDCLRRKKRKKSTSLDKVPEVSGDGDSPYEELERGEKQEKVHAILQTLPEQYRTVLVLRDIEELPSREVSRALKLNHATVRWRLHRARALFKDNWQVRYGQE
jgi:RNA polymerase sigma-70 factor (ECF subfamily)